MIIIIGKGVFNMEFKGSKTEANLWAAFAGESQARNKYTYFASKARAEGFNQIAAIFEETAGNEMEHAKIWFKLATEEKGIGSTAENLKADMYAKFAAEAKEEGFAKIAFLFEQVGLIEKEHEARYLKLLSNVEKGEVFAKSEKVVWQCSNCGYIHEGEKAPEVCPVCAHEKAFFQIHATNY